MEQDKERRVGHEDYLLKEMEEPEETIESLKRQIKIKDEIIEDLRRRLLLLEQEKDVQKKTTGDFSLSLNKGKDNSLSQNQHQSKLSQEEVHRLQRINQSLEEKILIVVDKFNHETSDLRSQVTELSLRLSDSLNQVQVLRKENDSLKKDCSTAVHLLAANPSAVDQVVSRLKDLDVGSGGGHYGQEENKSEGTFLVSTTFPPTALFNPVSSAVSSTVGAKRRVKKRSSSSTEDNDDQDNLSFLIQSLLSAKQKMMMTKQEDRSLDDKKQDEVPPKNQPLTQLQKRQQTFMNDIMIL